MQNAGKEKHKNSGQMSLKDVLRISLRTFFIRVKNYENEGERKRWKGKKDEKKQVREKQKERERRRDRQTETD